jgi:hypothetical protein
MLPFNGYEYVWGDDDKDGLLNYLDSPSFSLEESSAPLAKVLGSISLPIKIAHLLPSSDYGHMMEALHTWGVKETPIRSLMCPIVVDISNVYGVLSWLRTRVPGVVSADFFNKARNSLCPDGHWRSLWITRSNLDAFEVAKLCIDLVKACTKPDLYFDVITRFIGLFDFEIYILTGTGSVTAGLSFDLTSISQRLLGLRKYCKELFISVFEAIGMILTAIATPGFAGITLKLVAKLFNLLLDYLVFDYVQNDFLNAVTIVLKAIDPPGDRVVLQLFNANGQAMLIGHNKTSGEDISIFDGGLYSADNDSAILIVSRSGLDYNLTVTTTPTTATAMPYSMIIWDCTRNDTIETGGILDVGQTFSTRLNLTNNTLDTSYLVINASLSNSNPQIGEQVKASINVTDDEGNPQEDCNVILSIADEIIQAQNQGGGAYNTTIDTSAMAGLYNLTIFTRNAPPGFLQGAVSYPIEVGPHDIAIANVNLSKSILGLGYNLSIYPTLQNEGFFAETFNVTVYANDTQVETQPATLTNGTSTNVTFILNTTGFAYGNYTISVYAWPVPGETSTADNNFTGGWVMVSIVGDITGPSGWPDGKCDMRDVAAVARLFGVNSPDPRYNPNYDINDDWKINIKDFSRVARRFGEHYP